MTIEDVYVEGEDDTRGRNYVLIHGGLVATDAAGKSPKFSQTS